VLLAAFIRGSSFVSLPGSLFVLVTFTRGRKVSKVLLSRAQRPCPTAVWALLPRCATAANPFWYSFREKKKVSVHAKQPVGWNDSEAADVVCLVHFVSRDVLAHRIFYLADTGRVSTLRRPRVYGYVPTSRLPGLVASESRIYTFQTDPASDTSHDCHYLAVLMELITTS
jgi:hypothetical protein